MGEKIKQCRYGAYIGGLQAVRGFLEAGMIISIMYYLITVCGIQTQMDGIFEVYSWQSFRFFLLIGSVLLCMYGRAGRKHAAGMVAAILFIDLTIFSQVSALLHGLLLFEILICASLVLYIVKKEENRAFERQSKEEGALLEEQKGGDMAAYKMEITAEKIVKTLTFMGKTFTEVWKADTEDSWGSETVIEEQIMEAFPALDPMTMELLEELTCLDEDELVDAMVELTAYESLHLPGKK